jgi:hypothetical protein
MIQDVDPEMEINQLETDWNNYCSSYKGRSNMVSPPTGADFTMVFNEIMIATTDTDVRLNQMENMFERMINVLRASKMTEREVIDSVVRKLGE